MPTTYLLLLWLSSQDSTQLFSPTVMTPRLANIWHNTPTLHHWTISRGSLFNLSCLQQLGAHRVENIFQQSACFWERYCGDDCLATISFVLCFAAVAYNRTYMTQYAFLIITEKRLLIQIQLAVNIKRNEYKVVMCIEFKIITCIIKVTEERRWVLSF
jgi:hypothetical protein